MKTTKKIFSVAIGLLMLAAATGASATQYKFGHYFPSQDFRGLTATKFAEYAKAASSDLDLTVYPAESLVKGRDALQATSRGTVDFYSVFAGYLTGSIGLMKVFTIPFPEAAYDDARMMAFANDPKVIDLLDKQLSKSNVKLLGFINSSGETPVFLRNPVSKLADLNGRKIRGVGGYSDSALKTLGASVVFMSAAEQFIQLETGGVDGVVTTHASFVNLGLGGVAPYVLANTVLRTPYALMMNKRKWDQMSSASKSALTKATKETVSWSNDNFAKESARLETELTKKSKTIHKFTDTDLALARKTRDSAIADFAAENGEEGKAILEIYKGYQ